MRPLVADSGNNEVGLPLAPYFNSSCSGYDCKFQTSSTSSSCHATYLSWPSAIIIIIITIASLDPASSKIPDDTADGCHIGRCLVSIARSAAQYRRLCIGATIQKMWKNPQRPRFRHLRLYVPETFRSLGQSLYLDHAHLLEALVCIRLGRTFIFTSVLLCAPELEAPCVWKKG